MPGATKADRARKIIAEHICVPLEKVTDDAHLIDDLGCDSLDALELDVAFEEAFDITITDEMIDRWNTVGDLIRTVEGKD